MKKVAILFLILALLCGAALAEGIGDIAVRNGEFAAFLDGSGNIYITGRGEPVNATKAESLVDIDESRVLFHPQGDAEKLIALSLDGFTEAEYGGSAPIQLGDAGEGFRVYEDDLGDLCLLEDGTQSPRQIDSGARAWAIVGRKVFYLSGPDGALVLKQYSVDDKRQDSVLELPADIEPQLTASRNALFVLSSSNAVYSVDVSGKRLVNYATLPTPESFTLDGGENFTDYHIEAFSGQLNVYGVTRKAELQPVFEFVPSTESKSGAGSEFVLLQAYPIDGEDTTRDLLQAGQAQGAEGSAAQASEAPAEAPVEAPEELSPVSEPTDADDGAQGAPNISAGERILGATEGLGSPATPTNAPALRVDPVIGEVSMEVAHPDGSATSENVALIGDGDGVVDLSWAAEGNVDGYQVTITDSNGKVMVDQRMANPSAKTSAQNLALDEVYELTATAYFNDGQSSSSTLYFMRPTWAADEQSGADDTKEETPEEAPEEAGEGETSGEHYYLLDPMSWLENKERLDLHVNELEGTDGDSIEFVLNLEDYAAIEAYVEFLKDERFGLELREEYDRDDCRIYAFDRKDGAVDPIAIPGPEGITCDICVMLAKDYDQGTCTLMIYHAWPFRIDPTTRYVYNGVDDSADDTEDDTSSSDSSEDFYSRDSFYDDSKSSRKRCSWCNGTGEKDCRSCYGKGYIEQFVTTIGGHSEWVRKDCTNIYCRDGKIDCPYCDDGWVD